MTERPLAFVFLVLVVAAPVGGAGEYADGWTSKGLEEAVGACTDELVDGAWMNTKREQGVDPAMTMTPEIRQQLAPQIAAFRKLCSCTVHETAKKYGRDAYRRDADAVGRYAQELVKRGTCKPPQ
jgi:hypothetical protein